MEKQEQVVMSAEEVAALRAEFERIKAENESLKHKAKTKGDRVVTVSGLTLSVGKSGGLTIYGNGRFPHTFFLSQWQRIRESIEEIDAFVEANKDKFATKKKKEEEAA